MAKKQFTAKDQMALNKELGLQNKYLKVSAKQVDTMAKKYAQFSDKRSKDAKEYKKHLDVAQKRLDTMKDHYEEIEGFTKKINKEGHNLTKIMADHAKAQEKDIMGAMALQKWAVSKTKELTAQAAIEQGRLGLGTALTATLSLDVQMLSDVKSENIDIVGLYDSQDAILTEIATNHAEEVEAMKAQGASAGDIAVKLAMQAKEVSKMKGLFEGQVDKATEMNTEMSEKNALGIETREILAQQTEQMEAQLEVLDDLKKKAAKYIGIFSNGQLAFAFIANQIGKFARDMREFANTSGVSLGNSAKMVGQAKILNVEMAGLGVKNEDILAAQQAMLSNNMSMTDLTKENVKQTTLLSERWGMGADAAAKFRKDLLMMSGGSEKVATNLANSAIALAKANDIAPGAMLTTMAENSEEFARWGKKGFANVAKAAIAAKKLGVEFSSIVEAGRGLLDVETSIEAEMTASVLIGRELNLNAAREAALRGDHLTVTKELTKQIGSLEEFQSMNVIQQQALADAMGMSVGEITNMMGNQDKLNDLSEAGLEHYKATGEIQEQQEGPLARIGMLLAEHAEVASAIVMSMGSWKKELKGVLGFVGKLGKNAMNKLGFGGTGAPKVDTPKKIPKLGKVDLPKTAPKIAEQDSMTKGVSKTGKNMKNVVMGAVAMVLVAAAVWVFAKAVQEFMKVSWEAVGMAVVSMLALVGAVALLGMIMSSGVGAVAIILGAAAMVIVAAAMLLLAHALSIMASAIPKFLLLIPILPELAKGMMMLFPVLPIFPLLGLGLIALGAGLLVASVGILLFNAAGGSATLFSLSESLVPLAAAGPGLLAAGVGILALAFALPFLAIGLWMVGKNTLKKLESLGTALGDMAPALAPLAVLAGVGEGLATAGAGVAAIGIGMLPFAVALAIMAEYIPLIPMLAEGFATMAPPLVALAAVGEGLLIASMGLAALGWALLPFSFGMMMLSEYVPLIPIMAAGLVTMAPALLMMAPIAETFQTMGDGFYAIGTGLMPLAVSMAVLYPYIDAFPVVAQAMVDMAPPLILMAPYGPQIMFLGQAIGVLALTTALAAVPLFYFGVAAYFAAPAVEQLGQAAMVLGEGMERVAAPLLAMAAQFPSIYLLSGALFALSGSFLAAMLPTFGFGAAAMFASVGIGMMAASLGLLVMTAGGLANVGAGLSSIAEGLAEVSEYKGTLALLTIAAPALAIAGLTGAIGGLFGGGSDEKADKAQKIDTTALELKIDELITVVKTGGVINMDGRKVGEVLNLVKGPVGA